MKIPICHFCAKSKILCPICQDKLNKGEISQADIEVSEILIELEEKYPQIRDIALVKAVKPMPNIILALYISKDELRQILSRISKEIQDKKGILLKFVKRTSSIRKIMDDIISPARVVSINTIWLPDGSWESNIYISPRDRKKLPLPPELIEKIVYDLINEKIHIIF
ncbi:MAG: hypothetical protein QXY40_05730 [Candidatus Methanomethylicia archaeon]